MHHRRCARRRHRSRSTRARASCRAISGADASPRFRFCRPLSMRPVHPPFIVSSAHRHPPLLACPIPLPPLYSTTPALVVDSFPSRNGVPGGGDPHGWRGGGGCRRAGRGRRACGPGRSHPAQEPRQRAPR
jgi:hypothetical protein